MKRPWKRKQRPSVSNADANPLGPSDSVRIIRPDGAGGQHDVVYDDVDAGALDPTEFVDPRTTEVRAAAETDALMDASTSHGVGASALDAADGRGGEEVSYHGGGAGEGVRVVRPAKPAALPDDDPADVVGGAVVWSDDEDHHAVSSSTASGGGAPNGKGIDPLMSQADGQGDDLADDDIGRHSGDGAGRGSLSANAGERIVLPGDDTQADSTVPITSAIVADGSGAAEGGRPTVVINDDGGSAGSAEQAPPPRRGIHPRFRERRRAVRRALGRRRMVGLGLGVIVVVVVLVIGTLLGSGLFVVKSSQVQVLGWQHADEAQVTEILDAVVGTPVLTVDEEQVVSELEAIAWVDTAKVETKLPNRMTVELAERTPLAMYRGADDDYRVIDADGRVLDIVAGFPIEFIWVTSASSPNLQVGEFAPTGFSAAAQLSARLSAQIRPRVQRIAVEPSGSAIVVYLRDGSRVNFGAAQDLLIKLVRLDTLLSDFPEMTEANIDVSTEETTRASDALLKIKEAERRERAAAEAEAQAAADEVAAAESAQTATSEPSTAADPATAGESGADESGADESDADDAAGAQDPEAASISDAPSGSAP